MEAVGPDKEQKTGWVFCTWIVFSWGPQGYSWRVDKVDKELGFDPGSFLT